MLAVQSKHLRAVHVMTAHLLQTDLHNLFCLGVCASMRGWSSLAGAPHQQVYLVYAASMLSIY